MMPVLMGMLVTGAAAFPGAAARRRSLDNGHHAQVGAAEGLPRLPLQPGRRSFQRSEKVSQSARATPENQHAFFSGAARSRLARIFRRTSATRLDSHAPLSLEEIHHRLRTINSQLWRQLRTGVLSGCYVGLSSVRLNGAAEGLDWREVNRRTVSALHRLETATTDAERRASVEEAVKGIGQKLLLVQKAALRKADSLNREEQREIQKNESELRHLSYLLCLPSIQDQEKI
ncbi:MAG: hypothetical protein ACLFVT_02145 [Syntrophobacteria bacterium]